ncbi:beta-galactosidase [Mucisphaera calidilacus]|uniref:Beta-galactosidase BgaB n=1 Tax=Mucisphaera calidilacus TaxID=2527982 RepID=A0A518BWY5_9BACT|nr:beta-galactosidase [Mucisphaera calidilacus]QDU71490.1 Beta-galactosidase BgaB [Mucisphaera calidilacus]
MKNQVFTAVMYFAPHQENDRESARRDFITIRACGFDTIRIAPPEQVLMPGEDYDLFWMQDWLDTAAEEGLTAIVHAFEEPPPGILKQHQLDLANWHALYSDDPRFLAVLDDWVIPVVQRFASHPGLRIWAGPGEPPAGAHGLARDTDHKAFIRWLRDQYGTADAMDQAWNPYPAKGYRLIHRFEDASRVIGATDADGSINGVHGAKLIYGAQRDLMRFLTDNRLEKARAVARLIRSHDTHHPVYFGSHHQFGNNPEHLWDNAAMAKVGDGHGTSIHLSWHFESVDGEIDLPLYIHGRLTRDAAKGQPTANWEATGGPVQFSGGYGNHMSPGLMRRICLSILASGNQGIGFWSWNARPGGWEVGEYGMTARDGSVTPWADAAGQVAQAARTHSEELASADHHPRVGILQSWDTEAIYCLEPDRHEKGLKHLPREAWIGTARALTNHAIPYAFVDETEISADAETAADRWPCIMAMHLRALSDTAVDALEAYVLAGGRLVTDVSFGWLDAWGKSRPPSTRLTGGYVNNIHDTRTTHKKLDGLAVTGFFGDLVVDDAQVLATFEDGRPGIIEARRGHGSVVLIAIDPGTMCLKGDRPDIETMLASITGQESPLTSERPLTYRLTTGSIDHVFVINPGQETTCRVALTDRRHQTALDVLNNRTLATDDRGMVLTLPAEDALWLRLS